MDATDQILKQKEVHLTFEASGNSKEEAYGAIFKKLRNQIYDQINGVILHMEPTQTSIIDEKKESYTERFFWLFMPREKVKYTTTLNITVTLKYIET